MAMKGRVGYLNSSDGVETEILRLGRSHEQIVGDAHAKYAECVQRGNVYSAINNISGATVAAGGNVTNPLLALYNPLNSGVNLVMLVATFHSVSGTVGAGYVSYQLNGGQSDGSGAAGVTITNCLTGRNNGSLVRAYSATTNALAAVPNIIRPMLSIAAQQTTPVMMKDLLDGEFVIQPGGVFAINPSAAGTTWVCIATASWEEVPV